MEPEAAGDFAFKKIGFCVAGQSRLKPIRIAGEQHLFCGGCKAQATKAITIERADELVTLEALDCKLFVGISAGKSADHSCRELAGEGGHE